MLFQNSWEYIFFFLMYEDKTWNIKLYQENSDSLSDYKTNRQSYNDFSFMV